MKAMCYIFFVILSLMFSSCSKNDGMFENNFSPSDLVFKAILTKQSGTSDISKSMQTLTIDTILIFSGEDISWFNETTGELKFNDDFSGIEEVTRYNSSVDLLVYSDNDSLYSINLILTSDVMSWVINSPVIFKEIGENAYYIKNGYPDRNLAELDKDNPWRREREMNWNELVQSDGWKLFILQLKEEGRYRK